MSANMQDIVQNVNVFGEITKQWKKSIIYN